VLGEGEEGSDYPKAERKRWERLCWLAFSFIYICVSEHGLKKHICPLELCVTSVPEGLFTVAKGAVQCFLKTIPVLRFGMWIVHSDSLKMF